MLFCLQKNMEYDWVDIQPFDDQDLAMQRGRNQVRQLL